MGYADSNGTQYPALEHALVLLVCILFFCLTGCDVVRARLATGVETPTPTRTATAAPITLDEVVRLATSTSTPSPTATTPPIATPTPTATPIPQTVVYRHQVAGFTLSHPDNWLIDDGDEAAIIVASDQTRLNTNQLNEGGVIFLFSSEVAGPEPPDPVAILTLFVQNYVVFDSEDLTQPAISVRIGSQTAAKARAEAVFNRYPVRVTYHALANEARFLVAVAMVADDSGEALQPVVTEIIESIQLMP